MSFKLSKAITMLICIANLTELDAIQCTIRIQASTKLINNECLDICYVAVIWF